MPYYSKSFVESFGFHQKLTIFGKFLGVTFVEIRLKI